MARVGNSPRFVESQRTGALRDRTIHVTDVQFTRSRTSDALLQDAKAHLQHCRSIRDVERVSSLAMHRLTSLGVLKDYRVAVVPDPNAMSSRDVVVVVVMEEPGWYSGGIGVYTESGKVELDINGRISNVLGHAESLTTKLALKRSSEWSLETTASAPLQFLLGAGGRASLAAFQRYEDRKELHGCRISNTGGRVEYHTEDSAHTFSIGSALRDVLLTTDDAGRFTAPAAIAALARPSALSDARYTFLASSLDDPFFPAHGYKVMTELGISLPGSTENIVSGRVELVRALSADVLGLRHTLKLSANAAATMPLGATRKRGTHLADRHTLGGVPSFRGFRDGGVGPQCEGPDGSRRCVGGDVSLRAGASLLTALPFLSSLRPHVHTFLQAGTLMPWHQATPTNLRSTMRVSAGAGIVFPTVIGNVEFSATRVMRSVAGDRPTTSRFGFQWGLHASPGS